MKIQKFKKTISRTRTKSLNKLAIVDKEIQTRKAEALIPLDAILVARTVV